MKINERVTVIKIGKRAVALAAAVLAAGGLTLAAAGAANAAVPVTYSNAGANAVAGWFAHSLNAVSDTHMNSYIGSAGGSTLENLPAVTTASGGTVITSPVKGGVGIGFCDEANGDGAQVGDVYIGGGLVDVVAATGNFNSTHSGQPGLPQNSDPCEDGVVSASATVLIPDVSVNDTVDVDMQSNPFHSFNGHPAGSVAFQATDLNHPTEAGSFVSSSFGSGNPFTEMDAGVISDTTLAIPVTGTPVPASDAGALAHSAPNELVRFAHVKVSVNVTGGHESHGNTNRPLQASNADWTAFPVAATADGLPTGALYLDPSNFGADNFYVAGGLGLVS